MQGEKWPEPELNNITRYGEDEELEAAADKILAEADRVAKLGAAASASTAEEPKEEIEEKPRKEFTPDTVEKYILPDGQIAWSLEEYKERLNDYREAQ